LNKTKFPVITVLIVAVGVLCYTTVLRLFTSNRVMIFGRDNQCFFKVFERVS